jgi:hypothetical protein
MIRDILRAAVIVVAFLVVLADIQEHDEAALNPQFSTTKEQQ